MVLIILFATNYSKHKKYLIILTIFLILIIQFIPVFDRTDPFFETHPNKDYENIGVEAINDGVDKDQKYVEAVEYNFEFITDRLNRTAPWVMFYEGYKPNINSFLFGHGPGAYLNIVKNSDSYITSGPHSSVLQILNRFGILTLFVLLYFIYLFIKKIITRESRFQSFLMIILIILMLSFEIKTDTLMLMDGVYIFGFNIVIINLFVKLLSSNISNNEN